MKMKKIAILMMVMVFGITVMAMAETTMDTSWGFYGGDLNIDFQSGDDARVQFGTGGNQAFGSFLGIDSDNNPYGYNVDNTRSQVNADIVGGGYISFRMDRQDSSSSYGDAGQYTATQINSSDKGSFATNTGSNFAAMKTSNYGFQANDQYSASGSYLMNHVISAAPGSQAGFEAVGNGSTTVTLMSSEMRASGWKFGEGAGCYTNADASGTGEGEFVLFAQAGDYLRGNNWSSNGGSFTGILSYTDGFSYDNINMVGNGSTVVPE